MIRNDGCIATDWGGAREGAGRPRSKSHTDKAAHSFWCSTEEYEYLKKCLAAYREKTHGPNPPCSPDQQWKPDSNGCQGQGTKCAKHP